MKIIKLYEGLHPRFSEIETDLEIEDIYRLIGCDCFTTARILVQDLRSMGAILLADDEGLLKLRPINICACILHGTIIHNQPIVGNALVVKVAGEDMVGFDEEEIKKIKALLYETVHGLKEE